MNSTAIEQSVLGSPKSERVHLVHLLLDRLDMPPETDVQGLWLTFFATSLNLIAYVQS